MLINAADDVVAPASDLPHRKDIDGLRAIAVLLVLCEHLDLRFARGGFIGVDVFFVISGYLITGNILRGLGRGVFSVSDFYERRFRRIMPALTVMLVVVTLLAYLFLLPGDLVTFGHTLIAAICCVSNLYLSTDKTGYFGANSSRLLLHTWSLGVEEQFYLFIPLGLMLLARLKKRPEPYLAGIAFLSFVCAVWLTRTHPSAAFYMPYTRAWELLCGSLLASGCIPAIRTRTGRSILSFAALASLALFSWFYVPAVPFPGASALVPCLAASALIMTGADGRSFGHQFLTARPLPFIGAISYSLYLWHWPVIVLTRLGAVPGVADKSWKGYIFVFATSLLLATLSWRWVERPFRFGVFRRLEKARIFTLVATSTAVLIATGTLLINKAGFPQRFSARELLVASALDSPHKMREGKCFLVNNIASFSEQDCLHQDATRKNILLFGDSHAAALWLGLQTEYPDVNFLQVTAASCHPTYGHYRTSPCSQLRKRLFEQYLGSLHLEGAILTERWLETDDPLDFLSAVNYLHQRSIPVIVIGPAPEYTAPLPLLLSLGEKFGRPSLAEQNRVRSLDEVDEQLAVRLRGMPGVRYLSLLQTLCGTGRCVEYADALKTVPMLSDDDHFSPPGSVQMISALKNDRLLSF